MKALWLKLVTGTTHIAEIIKHSGPLTTDQRTANYFILADLRYGIQMLLKRPAWWATKADPMIVLKYE